MKTNPQYYVSGTKETHSIEVRILAMSAEEYDAVKDSIQYWKPETGRAETHGFKTHGAARAWLTRLLRRNGWNEPTQWIITTHQNTDGGWCVYLVIA